MGLETGTGIGDLVPTNPLSTDAVSAGDDHIRLIKTVMQSITFLKNIVTFTASGTWTRPANVKKIIIYCLGGGAGGGGGTTNTWSGGGGSGGGMAIKWLDVSAIASAVVTIGAGGAGGASAGVGSNGGDTTFITPGPVVQCRGIHGEAGASSQSPGVAASLTLNIGDIKFVGGDGTHATGIAATSPFAPGGQGGGLGGGCYSNAAQPNSGGGGGGGFADSISQTGGAAGGSGYCIILEFGW